MTNKTITDPTNTVRATQLGTTTTDVIVSSSAAPVANNVLVTSNSTTASWGTVPNSALTNSSVTINTTGPGLSGGGTVSLGGTLALVNGGVTSINANGLTNEVGNITLQNGTAITITDSPAGTFTFNHSSYIVAGSVGSSTAIPVLNYNAQGHLTSATTAAVIAPAGTLTGTILASNVITSSLTTVGTIGAGTWQGSIIGTAYGGTGLNSSSASNGSLLIGNGTGFTLSTLTAGSAIGILNSVGGITISNNGVISFSAGTTGLTPSSPTTGSITLGGILGVGNGGTGVTTTPTNGQLLIGNGTNYTVATLASGTGISTTVGAGALQINNAGVTSNIAGTGISVSGGTGAVTITNTGVTSIVAGTGITVSGATGAVTVSANVSLIPARISAVTTRISVGSSGSTVVGYVPWQNSAYSTFTTRTVTMWVVPSSSVGKNLTVSILPNGGGALGSLTINGGSAVGAIYTFTFTAPGADTNLQISVSRTGGAGNNPLINGVTIILQ